MARTSVSAPLQLPTHGGLCYAVTWCAPFQHFMTAFQTHIELVRLPHTAGMIPLFEPFYFKSVNLICQRSKIFPCKCYLDFISDFKYECIYFRLSPTTVETRNYWNITGSLSQWSCPILEWGVWQEGDGEFTSSWQHKCGSNSSVCDLDWEVIIYLT